MTETRNGLPRSWLRDAAMTLGAVVLLMTIGMQANAEPALDPDGQTTETANRSVSTSAPMAEDAAIVRSGQTQNNGNSANAPAASSPLNGASGENPSLTPAVSSPTARRVNNVVGNDEARQINCLAEAIYYEARGEPRRGQEAVAEVVATRVASRAYPNTFCGVVYQRAGRACQFSWACHPRSTPRGAQWVQAQDIATRVVAGWDPNVAPGATHFHTVNVSPSWARIFPRVATIGSHVFYRQR